jgi:transposase InsO family protein
MRLVREFSQHRHAQAVFRAALRVQRFLVSCLATGRSVVRTLSRHKTKVVRLVDRVGDALGQRRTLRMLGLTSNRLTRWRNSPSRHCPSSLLGLCLRTHPQQLSGTEVHTIKEVMSDERLCGWPLVSIYWRLVRDGVFGFALSTFYLYVKRFGLGPHRVPSRRKDHQTGIRATRPNEIWHADVTVFRTLDNVKAFIYLVVDNYSRRILSWAVDTALRAHVHLETVRQAWLEVGRAGEDSGEPVLLTDGGPENATDDAIPVSRLIAGRDIRFSNSMVESINKIVKYQSLYLHDLPDVAAVHGHLEKWIPIYNTERPHCALGYLTPQEAHEGAIADPTRFVDQMRSARLARAAANRTTPCPICNGSES